MVRLNTIFTYRGFRRFWLGFSLSVLGDAMTRVALTWYVYDRTKSAEALGLLALTYTGPVIVGGFVAGPLLDRFDRRKVMMIDNLIRGCAVLLIPLLAALNLLQLWHIYAVTLVYGSLVMFSLAGSPALVPELVDADALAAANALETLSYTLSGIIGPPLAGTLLPLIGAPNIVIIDAFSYFALAAVLVSLPLAVPTAEHPQPTADAASYRLSDAVRLMLRSKVLLSTTLMFMCANLGFGALFVWLPIMSDQILGGGAALYGFLLGALALGEVVSSALAGIVKPALALGSLICLAQILSGVALGLMILSVNIPLAALSFVLLGLFSAPLTIWAQTLRMKVIPERLRGRTFALLRTLMQSTNPLGGALGGLLTPLLPITAMIVLSALLIGIPGALGGLVDELRKAS